MLQISDRVSRIAASQTVRIGELALAMQLRGRDVIQLATGEPDFDTPAVIRNAAIDAISRGATRYTPVRGTPEIRAAVCRKLSRDNQLHCTDDQVMVTAGAKQALALALEVLVGARQEVIVPAPYWVSYPEMVKLADGIPVFTPLRADLGYKLSPDDLSRAISARSRVLILNTPGNPAGNVYTREELLSIADVCRRHGIRILSDEIYEKIVFNGRHHSIAACDRRIADLTVTINGCSKAFAMTGWRIGYAAGRADIIAAMAKLAGQRTTCPSSISQAAASAALDCRPGTISDMTDAYRRRRDLMVAGLNAAGIRCRKPAATFYLFADIRNLLGRKYRKQELTSSQDFTMRLLEHAGVAVVPGEAFGAPHHIRLSFAAARKTIEQGIERIAAFVGQLS